MPLELVDQKAKNSIPVYLVRSNALEASGADEAACTWAQANNFTGAQGTVLPIPGKNNALAGAFFGLGSDNDPLAIGKLARALPAGAWHLAQALENPTLAAIALKLGAYAFTRYGTKPSPTITFALPDGADGATVERVATGSTLTRDLANTPTNDLGPDDLERAARTLAEAHGAKFSCIIGADLLTQNFPLIHAVGRASAVEPRLIDFTWGPESAPKITLVGKGVCFDTGGLDIKPPSSMLTMKKDMGGAAHVLGLASMIMAAKLPVRLRVLIPAVENSISANAFRPGDVLPSRKGITVEIGNTDAEGRLVLADALTLADEETPELLIDMATLTGAARVALGPDLPPFYTNDETFAAQMTQAADQVADPLWRMPLWQPYAEKLKSRIADLNNVTTDGFAGSITAALFLQRFVKNAKTWAHFDIFSWTPIEKPTCPIGAEAQAIRGLYTLLSNRYGA